MRVIWGHWGSVEIVRGQLKVSGGCWCSIGVVKAQW